MSDHLNLNKEIIRRDVAFRLRVMGYDLPENIGVNTIRKIIKIIQKENGLVPDGLIGKRTMPLLDYNKEDIARMLKPKCKYTCYSRYLYCPYYPYRFLSF